MPQNIGKICFSYKPKNEKKKLKNIGSVRRGNRKQNRKEEIFHVLTNLAILGKKTF